MGDVVLVVVCGGVTFAVGYLAGWAWIGKGPSTRSRRTWWSNHMYDFRQGPWVWLRSPLDWFYALQLMFVGLVLSAGAISVFTVLVDWSVLGWALSLFKAPSVAVLGSGPSSWLTIMLSVIAAFAGMLVGTHRKVQRISTDPDEVREGIRLCLARIEQLVRDIETKRGWWQKSNFRAGTKFSVLVKEGLVDLSELTSAVTPWDFVRAFHTQLAPRLATLGSGSDLDQLLRDYDLALEVMKELEILRG